MHYPRLLIFGQTFNNFSGGGITLTNLFKGWPKEKVAVLSYPYMLHNSSTGLCSNLYQLGNEEIKYKFPMSLIKQKFPSGQIEITDKEVIPVLRENRKLRHQISSIVLNPALRWTGLIHCVSSLTLSSKLKHWLINFRPEIIYIQISNRESILFANIIIDYLQVPSVLHMMDDWPSTISSRGLFKKIWQRKIDNEFRTLLDSVTICLSISDAMTEEYLRRYKRVFKPFHNPVNISVYNRTEVVNKRPLNNEYRVLYFGRIGVANRKSLLFFAKAISRGFLNPLNIRLDIFSKDIDEDKIRVLRDYENVKLNPAVNHNSIPGLIQHYDILLLPLDFTGEGLTFARFSMPTKASEYMLSGKPILIFAPGETAVSKFFSENNCGYCVDKEDGNMIEIALKALLFDIEYIQMITSNAQKIAREKFDGDKVRYAFQTLLSEWAASSKDNSLWLPKHIS